MATQMPLPRDAGRASLELPEELLSASVARRFVETTLASWDLVGLVDDAVLIVTEMTANAVTHGRSSSELVLQRRPSGIRIELTDHGGGIPERQAVSFTSEHGRGLLLIGALSSDWGTENLVGTGKRVWAELVRAGSAAGGPVVAPVG